MPLPFRRRLLACNVQDDASLSFAVRHSLKEALMIAGKAVGVVNEGMKPLHGSFFSESSCVRNLGGIPDAHGYARARRDILVASRTALYAVIMQRQRTLAQQGRRSESSRRSVMASIPSRHTKPELRVRRILWGSGVRYRLHAKELPGRPDVVIRSRKIAIFVHGCLWHLHEGCKLARVPKSRPDYWPAKLARNKARDQRETDALRGQGWTVEVVWECETFDAERLRARLAQLLAAIRCATP